MSGSHSPRRVLVIGLGNPDRGDDGVGALVARRLAGRLPAGVELRTCSGDVLSLIEDWAGFDALVCVDAAAGQGAPGRIHRIDCAVEPLPRGVTAASSHALGLGEALELARALDRAPRAVFVYAIEGAAFEPGAPLTPAVAEAAAEAADRVAAEVARIRGDPAQEPANA